jgi:predicted DNA-binding WGR domain protein
MEKFIVVQVRAAPDPQWALEWTRAGEAANVTVHLFGAEADARRWADRLNTIDRAGNACGGTAWPD